MSATDSAPKVKYAEEGARKLRSSEIEFMQIIEKQNLERVQKLKKLRRNNLLTAGALGASVFSIYLYSMLSVKQEKFLDDFETPQKISTE